MGLAQIVHTADVPTDIYAAPEGPGLKAIAHGFALVLGRDDRKKIELEMLRVGRNPRIVQ